MDDARVEKLARSMCVAARTDPDSIVDSDFAAPWHSSIGPASRQVPAWHRFREAAENTCRLRDALTAVHAPRTGG